MRTESEQNLETDSGATCTKSEPLTGHILSTSYHISCLSASVSEMQRPTREFSRSLNALQSEVSQSAI